MRKFLILYGIAIAFTSLLFGMDRHFPVAALFEPDGLEKISPTTSPSSSSVVLPPVFQPAGEPSVSDQSKKIKTLLGSSFQSFIYKSLFPTIQTDWIKSHRIHLQLFILFRNLRI